MLHPNESNDLVAVEARALTKDDPNYAGKMEALILQAIRIMGERRSTG